MKASTQHTILASAVSMILSTGQLWAQENAPATGASEDIEQISVVGIRSSIASSVARKQESGQMADVITAEDIGKFPDLNVAESLQRIPGIQISRSRGEASGVSIRGLDEVATLLNGRNYFGGGSELSINRFASFEDIPAELVGSVVVYKSVSADILEGGIGGVVDIERTDALSLSGPTIAGSFKEHYGDLSKKWSPRGSLVAGNIWDYGNSGGEIGVIFGVSYLEREYREDLVRNSSSTPIVGDFLGGSAPEGAKTSASLNSSPAWGDRERTVYSLGVDISLNSDTKFYFDSGYTNYTTTQFRQEFVWAFDGSNVVDADFSNMDENHLYPASVALSDMDFDALSMVDNRKTKTYDLATGFETVAGPWSIEGEVSYVNTDNDTNFHNTRIRDDWDALPVTVNNSGSPSQPPSFDFGNFNVADENNYDIVQWRHESRQLKADESAAKLDVDYAFEDGMIRSIEAGLRFANLGTTKNIQNNHIFDASGATYGSDDPLNLVEPSVWDNFMDEYDGANFPNGYVAVNPDYLLSRNDEIRDYYGFTGQSETENPRDSFDYEEKVSAFYVKANFETEVGGLFVSGDLGGRYVQTDTTADYFFDTGNTEQSGAPIYEGTKSAKDYSEFLPSFNVKVELNEELLVRVAGSKTFSRPHFGDLAPSLNLNFEQGRGTGGNPDLDPFTATNLDLSLEYYFASGGLASSTVFYKDIDGFLQTSESAETIGGNDFVILRKSNGGSGTVRGIELAYQQFFDFLPAPFDGLGLQANYTYVDSDVPSPNPLLPNISLEGLSDNSYNLVAIYEDDLVSGRLSYNYRSDFLVSTEVAQEGFGQLDLSLAYNVSESFRLTLDALNLLRRDHFEYRAGDKYDPYHWIATEKQVLVGVSYTF
ncbi:TonB-dependent receptor [Paraglaciecola polaris]|uniref:TonB-dependent receptor n=3 Tax=Paraglaciecola polaris TaxID=222814 RepID=K7AH35_9ALTE|nr:TonB-dependent receptor [Paraglaciecola polaris]GAC34580.1 TonB-dependent receptor [Paraglaciecola polaris LMG 21857]